VIRYSKDVRLIYSCPRISMNMDSYRSHFDEAPSLRSDVYRCTMVEAMRRDEDNDTVVTVNDACT